MVSGYLFKITGWQCNGWSKLESWGGKRSENVRGDKINDQCSPPSEMLLFFGAFYSVQSVRAFNLVAKLSPYKGELVRTGFCPYYYKWSWGRNEYLSSFCFPYHKFHISLSLHWQFVCSKLPVRWDDMSLHHQNTLPFLGYGCSKHTQSYH